jgi:predicted HD superfamily hydrolase involved in NAD metabolism
LPVDESLLDRAAVAVRARLNAKHAAHSEGTSALAREMAVRYGVDPDEAALAGLLHDWCREVPGDTLLAHMEATGAHVLDVEAEVPHLLHAHVAALVLPETFPDIPAEVLDAIATHTLGAPDISDLGKIVYIADMIEEGRAYSGVERLREAVARLELDEAFREAYARSVTYLVEARKPIHPETVLVWNTLVAETAS